MKIPNGYEGREQTYLKHQFLRHYLTRWAHMLGSIGRSRRIRLCYVDCFAGPWQSEDEELLDTSVAIGLQALTEAADTWAEKGNEVDLSAVFVESHADRFRDLNEFVDTYRNRVDIRTHHGEFGEHVHLIDQHIGDDPAFLFVDPKGWKGAAMRFIQPLAARPRRDVLVNVMFHHINRFKTTSQEQIRHQIREFFGIEDELPPNQTEEALMNLYRTTFKERCGLRYVADAIVPHPTRRQTKFRLVIGGHDTAVLSVFREAEWKVIGREAGEVRSDARERDQEARTGQLALSLLQEYSPDDAYRDRQQQDLADAELSVPAALSQGPLLYRDLWPDYLEAGHFREVDFNRLVRKLVAAGVVRIDGLKPRAKISANMRLFAAR